MRFSHSEEVRHEGLGKVRTISGPDKESVAQKARALRKQWEGQYQAKRKKERAEVAKHEKQRSDATKHQGAKLRTLAAAKAITRVRTLLAWALAADNKFNWEGITPPETFERSAFEKPKPSAPRLSAGPSPPDYSKLQLAHAPPPPQKGDKQYTPKYGVLGHLLPAVKARRDSEAREHFAQDFKRWETISAGVESINRDRKEELDRVLQLKKSRIEAVNATKLAKYEEALKQWEAAHAEFQQEQTTLEEQFHDRQRKRKAAIKELKRGYAKGDPKAIQRFCELVLKQSQYPKGFPKTFELDYIPETKILLVEYSLPTIDKLPCVVEVEYIESKQQFKEVCMPSEALKSMYDDALYQIALRTVYELFDADSDRVIDAVNFNGWVDALSKSTGKRVNSCILSVFVLRSQLAEIDLSKVDPKACFKLLKGVCSSQLHGLTPIAPIMQIERADKRFVQSYSVAGSVNEGVNIAAMDWEDFEHLVRELFEKEFTQYGGEVKITQASRDGGVDAVAFDPDPIRGGKTVIQAKRYTNVVGLSAVRDLYGTVLNEGATKGILVTTADYGPDAYEFVKDKPLTLLNGSNLLHLLEKHGHKATIDLQQAKQILAEQEKAKPGTRPVSK